MFATLPRPARGIRARRATSVMLMMAMLTGCAPVVSPNVMVSESSSMTPPPPTGNPGYSPRPALSRDLVPGLREVTRTDEANRVFARWFSVPGHPEVGHAQQVSVDAEINAFLGKHLGGQTGGSVSHELSIESELTASSSAMLGIRSTISAFEDGAAAKEYRTQWFDLKSGRQLKYPELFVDEASGASFAHLVKTELVARGETDHAGPTAPDDTLPQSLNFDASGDALVEFDERSVGAGDAGNQVVKLPSAVILPLLGERGRQAREAGMRPTALPAPASPSPSAEQGTGGKDNAGEPDRNPRREVDCKVVKCVALTFDDGPGPKTEKLLDMLSQAHAAATFFVVGPNAEARPKTLVRMLEEGHEIGNHTWNHRVLTSLAPERRAKEIGDAARAIQEATGVAPTLMRPPYGATNAKVKQLAGAPVILWDVDTLDWKVRDSRKVVANTLRDTRPGSIVLMHDIHASTVDAVPAIIKGLRAKGYHFVTVSQLLGSPKPLDGVVYTRGQAPSKTAATAPPKR